MDKEKLYSFYKSRKFSDCTFRIDGEEIKAHKLILACKSPVFEKMFFGDLASSEISISDIDSEEFLKVLEFIYTDKIDIFSVANAWSVFYIAKKYLLEDLIRVCLTYIRENLSLNNLALSYEYAEMFNIPDLEDRCLRDMTNYARGVFSSDYHMKSNTLCSLLENMDLMYVSEFDITIKIIEWGIISCSLQNIEAIPENIVDLLKTENLLQFIKNDWLIKLKCSECCDSLVICQCLDKLIHETLLVMDGKLIWNDDNCLTSLNKGTPIFCKIREEYKISCRLDLHRNEEFHSNLSVNHPIIVFGVLVKTQMNPANCSNSFYHGSVTVRICKHHSDVNIVKPTTFEGVIAYDSTVYVSLKHLVTLEPKSYYDLRISYNNYDEKKLPVTSVHCYYMFQELINDNSIVTFYEISGTLIKGLSFYPA